MPLYEPQIPTTERDMRDPTADLPPELRRMICELIPRASLKNIRFVNKLWSPAAAAVLWHTFSTDLHEDVVTRRDIDALLNSAPGGFLDSLKVLHIRKTPRLSRANMNTRLLYLLGFLPDKCLTKFSAEYEIDSRTLAVLIKRHPHLEELSVPMYDDPGISSTGPPVRGYVAGKLSCISSLTIFSSAFQLGYNSWFPHLTSLTTLIVQGRSSGCEHYSWQTARPLNKLRNLYLDGLEFSEDSGRLDWWLELSSLEKLTVRGCTNMTSFIQDLVISYTCHPQQSLKELSIVSDVDDQWIQELNTLLKLISGIERLHVSTSTAEHVEITSITRHGNTLRSLLMDPLNDIHDDRQEDEDGHLYDVEEFALLAEKCPNLEELGTTLVPLFFFNWHYSRPFAWSEGTEISADESRVKESLKALALFKKLRILRLAQPPLDVDDSSVENPPRERQWRAHNFAEKYFQYLAKEGSPIKLLALSPTIGTPKYIYHQDAVGHTFPHYYYLRGHSTIQLPNNQKVEQVVAHPVPKSEIGRYLDNFKVLTDPQADPGKPAWAR